MGGNGTKERITKLISEQKYGLTIEEIANALAINRMTASKYLAVLEASGKVLVREVGKAKLHYPRNNGFHKWLNGNGRKSSCGLNSFGFFFIALLVLAAAVFSASMTAANSNIPPNHSSQFNFSLVKNYPERLIIIEIDGPPLTAFILVLINPEKKAITPYENVSLQTDQSGRYELRIIGFVNGNYSLRLISGGAAYAYAFEVEPSETFECNRTFLEYRPDNAAGAANETFLMGNYVWDICRDFVEADVTREQIISEMVESRAFVERQFKTKNITGAEEMVSRLFVEKTIELLPEKGSFDSNEKPRFRLTSKKIFSERGRQTEETVGSENLAAVLYGPEGVELREKTNIIDKGSGEFEIEVRGERAFRPGLYKLRMLISDGGETDEQQAEFLWGVLALNTHKSIYLPDEQAFIGIAVLDNMGRMVCDAEVMLTITGPDGQTAALSTSDGTIHVSPECEVYGITNLPDYYAHYRVGSSGTYAMQLTALTPEGTRGMNDTFLVQDYVDFDVARDGPTRIYPPAKYRMVLAIRPQTDYTGPVREYVPSSFEITPQEGLAVTDTEDAKILEWDSIFSPGGAYGIAYEFDAPDVSPYLFALGPLEIGEWREAGGWIVASDAPGTEIDSCQKLSSANTVYELNKSITSNSGVCFNITADNVTLDGMGFSVQYAATGAGKAVYALGRSNATIKNLNINQTDTSRVNSPAIYLENCNNNSIYNNTLDISGSSSNGYDHGIQLKKSTNTTISQNTITMRSSCNYCNGIFINASSHQNTISSNVITSEDGSYEHGIEIRDSNQTTMYNNTIQLNNNYNQAYCIYLYNASNNVVNQSKVNQDVGYEAIMIDYYSTNNLITGSNVTAFTTNGGVGIRINQYSEGNNITNCNITSHQYSIQLGIYSHKVTVYGTAMSDDFVTAVYSDGSVNNVTIESSTINHYRDSGQQGALQYVGNWWAVINTLINCTGQDAAGIYTTGGWDNLNLTGVTITTNGATGGEALFLYDTFSSMVIRDSVINAGNDDDIVFYNSGTGVLNATNTTFTEKVWSGSAANTLNVFWYLDAYVNNTDGIPINAANVTAWDKDSVQAFTDLTNSSGWIPRQALQEYGQNSTDTYYYSNYTINASKIGYMPNSTQVNMTDNKVVYLTLSEACNVDFNMSINLQQGIMFAEQDPGTINASAAGNGFYNITDLSAAGCGTVNVSIMATGDLVNGSSVIGIGNVTVNSTSPDTQTIQLSTAYQLIRSNVPAGGNNITTLYFWLNVPAGQEPRIYNTTIYVKEEME